MTESVLDGAVLVLNKGWVPISIVTVRRAICMVICEHAQVVDAEDYSTYDFESWADLGKVFTDGEFILSPRHRIPVPHVILLQDYDKIPVKRVPFSRKNLWKRDEYKCQYCGKKPDSKDLTIDHVVPVSRGGATTWKNCVLACMKCNRKKADQTPSEAKMTLLRDPEEPPKRKLLFSIPISRKRITWDKFINDPDTRDAVASDIYWNALLKD